MIGDFDRLVEAVQHNCDVADARHATDLTLCTYLLEMREFYRWEHGIALSMQPLSADVGAWLSRREALWDSLQGRDFQALPVEGRRFEPFAVAAINQVLLPHRLVYSAGVGRFGRVQFHLGDLMRQECRGKVQVLVGGREYARDLGAAPAALLEATIYIRQESFQRWLWEKFEAWAVRKPDDALGATLTAYGFDGDAQVALERMRDAETETLILHELGEFEAGRRLGGGWQEMRAGLASRRVELLLRALRDNLADCLVTLPALKERQATASIHFWFATFEGVRRQLFPRLSTAYTAWRDGEQRSLRDAVAAGRDHWQCLCERALALYDERGADAGAGIEQLIDAPGTRL